MPHSPRATTFVLNHLHFAKIDIEGSELTALNSLFNDNRHPYILEVEISFLNVNPASSWELISLIEKMGYELLDVQNYSYKRIPKISPNSGKSF